MHEPNLYQLKNHNHHLLWNKNVDLLISIPLETKQNNNTNKKKTLKKTKRDWEIKNKQKVIRKKEEKGLYYNYTVLYLNASLCKFSFEDCWRNSNWNMEGCLTCAAISIGNLSIISFTSINNGAALQIRQHKRA